ncbi:leishmanolysin-related zinc metalloendopeptidase [Flavimaricola marinus]|uniref:Leishmanolysin n=1 Tax=Flavimaricola marinus TaxID=1819565 RepID=A0A238LGZ8_9RHOB|nr:leishmanolysin-related zinc metalloendopeptidase [Flavimaricola marinus]SMY09017.1 Leishmanolysin [Flavimaricola marinus]
MSAYSSFSADNFEFEPVPSTMMYGTAASDDGVSVASMEAEEVILTSYTSGQGEYGVVSDFNIEIIFEGDGWTEELQQDFILAAEYLSTIITGDVRGGRRQGVDDITITATLEDIDGSGGVLGQAGPTGTRFFSKIPTTAVMEFDTADAQDFADEGLFDDIVLHEMMHSLGFGTIWSQLGLTEGSVRGGTLIFTGENATLAYNEALADIADDDPNSLNGVPVETDGGPGTAGGHWDEDTFTNELMSGFIDDANYISAMTVAAFEDMGYDTIFDANDPTAEIIQLDEFANTLFA